MQKTHIHQVCVTYMSKTAMTAKQSDWLGQNDLRVQIICVCKSFAPANGFALA